MAGRDGYGQYCPIAIAAEVMGARWTPLVLRALFCGATRFNDIHAGVPRMSPGLLTRRLRQLESAGVVARDPAGGYALTASGRELFPVLEAMGRWSQKWLRREVTADRNLDPDVLMWELRQTAPREAGPAGAWRNVCFDLGLPDGRRRAYWLVFEGGNVDVCVTDPGFDVDLWVTAELRTLVEIWLGHRGLDAALREGALLLDGPRGEVAAFRRWFVCSHFAAAGATEEDRALSTPAG